MTPSHLQDFLLLHQPSRPHEHTNKMGRKAALHDDETIAAGLQNAIASLAAQLRHDFPYLKTEALDLILADTHQVMYESIIEQ